MMKKATRVPRLLLLVQMAAWTATALAATYIVPSDEVLIGKAAVVVSGRVVGVESVEGRGGVIRTEARFAIEEVLKGGGLPSVLTVVQPGGSLAGRREVYPGTGSFREGERALLMLRPAGPDRWRLVDFALGKFRLEARGDGSEVLRRDGLLEPGATLLGPVQADPDRDPVLFERFIRNLSEGRPAEADYTLAPAEGGVQVRAAAFEFLTGGPGTAPARWMVFDSGGSVTIYDSAAGDAGSKCQPGGCHTQVAEGMAHWNQDAPGSRIALVYGGTDPSIGSKCLGNLSNQIQFNDPCNEIGNLSGCAGTLALGGYSSYATGEWTGCPAKGSPQFDRIAAGRILVNNGVGSCLSSCDYEDMIAHESGHMLGAGHSADSNALMAPYIRSGRCGVLQQDDIDFALCVYPAVSFLCSLSATPASGSAPLTVAFDAHPGGGTAPYTFDYDFGDGAGDSASNPGHVYTLAGSYTASVTVTDAATQTCQSTAPVEVLPCIPGAVTGAAISLRRGVWRAKVDGTGFTRRSTVEVDAGAGWTPAPVTVFRRKTRVVGKQIGDVCASGQPVMVRVLSPTGCPSNSVQATCPVP